MARDGDHGDGGFLRDNFIHHDVLDSTLFAWAPLCPLFSYRISVFLYVGAHCYFFKPI